MQEEVVHPLCFFEGDEKVGDIKRERKKKGGKRDRASGDAATSTVQDRHSLLTTA